MLQNTFDVNIKLMDSESSIQFFHMSQNAIVDSNPLHCSAMSLSELQHHPAEGNNENHLLEREFVSEEQNLEESMEKQKPKAKKVKKKTKKGLLAK